MFLERVTRPRYKGLVFKFKDEKPEEVLRVLNEWGFSFHNLSVALSADFDVESLVLPSEKPYIYLLLFKGGEAFLAMGDRGMKRRGWPEPKKYLIKNERGVENLIRKELSPKSIIPPRLIYITFWLLVWVALLIISRGNFFLSTLISLIGLPLSYFESFLHYHIFGYCVT
ncbi:hypothetical protein A3L09_05805 [Thermococcus profundus]|uniref:Uncharacterized protein n=1 Tax=Thermococcus profundus TaxID=49899 RepID=A0A2Z2MDN1_THEPR|nr:hypothetical protein [Thermococcus profundus]ASJ02802.1 hypothetical protein A3L09_05805 [Thermococcus profundus]